MKITFGNQPINSEYYQDKAGMEKKDLIKDSKSSFYAGTVTSFDGAFRACGKESEKKVFGSKEKTSLKDMSMQAGNMNVEAIQDSMLLCAHTMSEEDYAKMQEKGFDPADMTPEETVTILDKIKAEMIKAGQEVIGYTDSVDMTTLAAAVGSEGLARNIVAECKAVDLPVTVELAEEVAGAVQLGEEITSFSEEAQCYLLENHLAPTIYDLSVANFGSASNGQNGSQAGYSMAQGKGETLPEEELVRFLEKNDILPNAENLETSKWLVKNLLEISRENIECKQGLERLQFPLSEELLVKASVAAVADGGRAIDGNVLQPESLWQRSLSFLQRGENGEAELRHLTNRIRLEEVRLMMTADANLALLESDYAIDTSDMEKMIEEMKQIREKMAENLFPGAKEPTLLYDRLEETNDYVTQIRNMPLDTFGGIHQQLPGMELKQVAEEGKITSQQLKAAGLRYETMMTTPRADLGDRIQKAFANVDDILKDYDMEPTEENRKAVRTLAYCRMEIEPENIGKIRDALQTVENLTEKMTPAAVLKMLRDGVNPLEKSVEELTRYFEELPEDFKKEGEKYSRFLYHLEKNKEITAEEKEAYIGCFRLLRQIEKSDGAVIGDLVNTGAEWNLKNMLSALRSRNAGSTNRLVDDSTGALKEPAEIKKSIAAQIEGVFSAGAEKEYVAEKLQEYREIGQSVTSDLLEQMQQSKMDITPENVQVMTSLFTESEEVLENIRETLGKSFFRMKKEEDHTVTTTEVLPEDFDSFAEGMQEILAENIADVEDTLFQKEQLLDVRSLQLMHKQLHVMEQLSEQREYFFSLQIDEERVSEVHMQFMEDEENKGTIHLDLFDPSLGKISGELKVTNQVLQGYLMGNLPETVMKMQTKVDIISSKLPEEIQMGRVDIINEKSWMTKRLSQNEESSVPQDPETLYKIATVFVKELLA